MKQSLNALSAVQIFCDLAQTLQFKATAERFAVSPQVISRQIAQLEQHLGEVLFLRSTRQVTLTDFGKQFLPRAEQLLADANALLMPRKNQQIQGIIRIAVPDYPPINAVLQDLLTALQDYPDIQIHWRTDNALEDVVAGRIDLGIRYGNPKDSRLIVKKVGQEQEIITASPDFIARYGTPERWQDLPQFPLSSLINPNNGRIWPWELNKNLRLQPEAPKLLTNNMNSELAAVLSGSVISSLPKTLCRPYLETGQLVELLPQLPRKNWDCYLYRPKQKAESNRIKLVFHLLAEILQKRFG
ncbi:LysR family transcriptional regulator [Avibacterium sp. 21-599]|uniref:LysR family transcriptional regulator n=1 Tax=Avibacterium sp. 21-599 TaxID=2911528 RepID=UPI0022466CA2|nr:LysR family transcriptional regulator [Avibacterium sp. 21-599]MCW9718835.1 LysR family transcriptional regulator [Avibacterium sp. 21-599]